MPSDATGFYAAKQWDSPAPSALADLFRAREVQEAAAYGVPVEKTPTGRARADARMVPVDRRGVEALCTTVRERVLRDAKVA
jgi:hypothetical protein